MTPDLRVALSLWLNAYDDARNLDQNANDVDRVRKRTRVIEALADASEGLYPIADKEVETEDLSAWEPEQVVNGFPAVDGVQRNQFKNSYKLPPSHHMHAVMAAMIEWTEAAAGVYDAEFPTTHAYRRLENAEAALRNIVVAAKRRANAAFADYDSQREALQERAVLPKLEQESMDAMQAMMSECG